MLPERLQGKNDQIGQLVRDEGPERVSEYTYDVGGNMLTVTVNDVLEKAFYYENSQWYDQLTAVVMDGVRLPITYDPLGNMTSFNGRNFTWQRGRQLASITSADLMVTFTYDYTGLRSSKTVNGVTSYYVWAGGLLMARYTPAHNGNLAETLAWHYDQGGTMLGFARTIGEFPTAVTSYYFYVRNMLGDVVAVLDAAGDIVAEYTYDAWGNVLSATGPMAYINPITYRGYYKDWVTGLYYLQSRYYCPALRRFINADALLDTGQQPLGTNMYMYCLNDPVNLYDPDGFLAISGTAGTFLVATAPVWWPTVKAGLISIGTTVAVAAGFTAYVASEVAIETARANALEEARIQNDAYHRARNLMDFASTTASPPPPDRQTQLNSLTLLNRGGRNPFRIDVENPNPAQRPRQIHLQQGRNKYLYNPQTQQFHIGTSTGQLAPNHIQELLNDRYVVKAIGRGLRILGYGG